MAGAMKSGKSPAKPAKAGMKKMDSKQPIGKSSRRAGVASKSGMSQPFKPMRGYRD